MANIKVTYGGDGTYFVESVKGHARKALTELEFDESRKAVRRYADIANKRIRAILAKDDLYSPAVEGLKREQGTNTPHFSSVEGIDYNDKRKAIGQLHGRLAEIQKFLGMDTSTITGARQYQADVESRLGLEKVGKKTMGVIWGVINRVKQYNPIIASYADLGNYIYQSIQDEIPDMSVVENMGDDERLKLIDDLTEQAGKFAHAMYYGTINAIKHMNFKI